MKRNKLLHNSGIYSVISLLQKGINFFLIPILTAYLTTFDYGVVAVVFSINAFLNVFYLLSLNGSLDRFYYEYKNDEELVKKLFGTIVTFVFLTSVFLSVIILIGHKWIIDPFLGNVDFSPYMLLGMISILFNPIFTIFQSTLQARQEGKIFAKNNIIFFFANITFLLISVLVFNLGAKGVLGSLALTNFIFFIYTLFNFGKEIQFGINLPILKASLKYSLPLVPHSLSGVITNVIDKLFINNLMSTSFAGIYNIGNTFGSIVLLIASGVNQAFVPWFNEQIKKEKYNEIPQKAKLLIMLYSIIALGLSFFGKEIIYFATPETYHQAWEVIPFIAYAFVFHGVYYFFSAPMFYDISGRGNRLLPFFTISAATLNIALNLFLIPKYGIIGAALATLISKFILVISLSFVYNKFLKIKYEKLSMIFIPLICLVISLISYYPFKFYNGLIIKTIVFIIILSVSSWFLKRDLKRLIRQETT
ncbi:oligosaccharide flippase family protein [Gaetbulibacter sp. M235]|uniref:lipopolysaccharide biosynthesis protein n=1 Tax=Gaetbulibacter sp. M235 TaxID=3126510 RepID=UPI00374F7B8E